MGLGSKHTPSKKGRKIIEPSQRLFLAWKWIRCHCYGYMSLVVEIEGWFLSLSMKQLKRQIVKIFERMWMRMSIISQQMVERSCGLMNSLNWAKRVQHWLWHNIFCYPLWKERTLNIFIDGESCEDVEFTLDHLIVIVFLLFPWWNKN